MGTWGAGILADDYARDVYDEYMRRFNEAEAHKAILAALLADNHDELDDSDDGPVFWLAVAKAQWECGALSRQVLARVRRIVRKGQGLDRWEEAGPALLKRRQAALAKFAETIEQPKAKPRKPHKPRVKRAPYDPGTCLSMKLPDGDYGAVLVLAAEPEGPYATGANLVGLLRYKSGVKPRLADFEKREWLEVIWCIRKWHKKAAALLEPVGKIGLRPGDPQGSRRAGTWPGLITAIELLYTREAGPGS